MGAMAEVKGTTPRLVGVIAARTADYDGRPIAITVPRSLAKAFEDIATIEGMSTDELFEELLTDYVESHPRLDPIYCDAAPPPAGDHALMLSVEELETSVRLANVLDKANIEVVGDIVRSPHETIRAIAGMTDKTMRELKELLVAKGISWPEAGR